MKRSDPKMGKMWNKNGWQGLFLLIPSHELKRTFKIKYLIIRGRLITWRYTCSGNELSLMMDWVKEQLLDNNGWILNGTVRRELWELNTSSVRRDTLVWTFPGFPTTNLSLTMELKSIHVQQTPQNLDHGWKTVKIWVIWSFVVTAFTEKFKMTISYIRTY